MSGLECAIDYQCEFLLKEIYPLAWQKKLQSIANHDQYSVEENEFLLLTLTTISILLLSKHVAYFSRIENYYPETSKHPKYKELAKIFAEIVREDDRTMQKIKKAFFKLNYKDYKELVDPIARDAMGREYSQYAQKIKDISQGISEEKLKQAIRLHASKPILTKLLIAEKGADNEFPQAILDIFKNNRKRAKAVDLTGNSDAEQSPSPAKKACAPHTTVIDMSNGSMKVLCKHEDNTSVGSPT